MFLKFLLNILLDDIYKSIQESNPNEKRKLLIIFDDMLADILNRIVTELFIRSRKLNISLVFTTHSYFSVPKKK